MITPEGRGPDGWYYGHAGADMFEVWADVARRYRLDPDWTAIAGYSMGGYGTYKFATQYPGPVRAGQPGRRPARARHLGAAADPQPGGAASNTNRMLASVRNVPFLIWDGAEDELVPVAGAPAQAQTFDDLGYRYEFDLFTTAEHLTLAINDQYAPAAAFLGDPDGATATRRTSPTSSIRRWTSPAPGRSPTTPTGCPGLRLRDSTRQRPAGQVDARSEGFGRGDPAPEADPARPVRICSRAATSRRSTTASSRKPGARQRTVAKTGRAAPGRPQPREGHGPPGARAAELPREARRHHRRPAHV